MEENNEQERTNRLLFLIGFMKIIEQEANLIRETSPECVDPHGEAYRIVRDQLIELAEEEAAKEEALVK